MAASGGDESHTKGSGKEKKTRVLQMIRVIPKLLFRCTNMITMPLLSIAVGNVKKNVQIRLLIIGSNIGNVHW